MKTTTLGLFMIVLFSTSFAQGWYAPDKAISIPRTGSTGSYTTPVSLNHNGTQFDSVPVALCMMNCVVNDLYLRDFGMNIPGTVAITGIEVIHSRGACNSGSFMIDTLYLVYNGNPIGVYKRDTATISETDTLGSSSDLWGGVITPAMLNDPSFGVMIRSTGSGICTYGLWNLQIRVHYNCIAGQDTGRIPDSVAIVSRPGSNGSYTITNPLAHNGSQFTNGPVTISCAINCKANHLYFQDFDFNVPVNAQITGVELLKNSGACNQGSVMKDTIHLAYNGSMIGQFKWDSSGVFYSANFGSSSDSWGAALTPAMVNSPTFGVFVTSTSTGICTYIQSDLRMSVHYCIPNTPSGLSFDSSEQLLDFYPNPAQNTITLIWKSEDNRPFHILDLQGRRLLSGITEGERTEVSLNGFLPGFYLVQMDAENVLPKRLIVR